MEEGGQAGTIKMSLGTQACRENWDWNLGQVVLTPGLTAARSAKGFWQTRGFIAWQHCLGIRTPRPASSTPAHSWPVTLGPGQYTEVSFPLLWESPRRQFLRPAAFPLLKVQEPHKLRPFSSVKARVEGPSKRI
jgi:hypothetical protein